MVRAQLNVHDLPREVYDRLDVAEKTSEGTTWKTITAGSVEVVYFQNEPGEYADG